jgi:predicted enzyme related to lactoylglutathione lyase
MTDSVRPRVVGINHVALEVEDIDEALTFYGRLFTFTLRSRSDDMAFIDLGDQFIALQRGRRQPADDGRHFGLVVDDKDAARKALAAAGVAALEAPFLDFRDPWGNRIEIVGYDNIQFTKAANVLRGMRLTHLAKNASATKELAAKGMAVDRTPPEMDETGRPKQQGVRYGIAAADKINRTGSKEEPVRNTPPAGAWNDVSSD